MATTILSLVALAALPSFITAQGSASTIATTISPCLSSSKIRTMDRSNASWAVLSQPWQLRIKADPAIITYPTTKDEVAAILKCANEAKAKVSAMSAGHSMIGAGQGNPGTVVVNMSAFDSLTYDPVTTNYKIGSGNRVGPALTKLWKEQSRHFAHGRHGSVGIGLMLGGGFGSTSRFIGTPMDSIVNVEYMLYNGTVVNGGPGSDLLWAAQGAGSSFGVILSLTTKTYAMKYPNAVSYNLTVGAGTAESAAADLADGVKTIVAVQKFATTVAPEFWSFRWDISTHSAIGQYYGDPSTFDAVIRQPILAATKGINVTIDSVEEPFWESEKRITLEVDRPKGGWSPKRSFYIQALCPTADKPLTPLQFTTLLNATIKTFKRTDMKRSGFLDLWGGVAKKVKDSDTAYQHGNNLWLIRLDGNGKDNIFPPDGVEYFQGLMKPFEESLKATQGKLRGFANYRDTGLPKSEWSQRLHGDNWARLVKIKNAYDPNGMFTSNVQSIPNSG